MAQMALAWVLKDKRITSVLIGASSAEQVQKNVDTLKKLDFADEEMRKIEDILK
ncbi:MAG: aldo/keto reductase [Prolixibacteraceae bacterium]